MGVIAGANINDNGLIFSLDAANFRSYSGSGLTSFGLVGGIGGTLVNGVGFTSTNGGSFIFDGTNDQITVASDVLDIGLSDFTIKVWFKTNSSANGSFIANQVNNGWNGFNYWISNGQIYCVVDWGNSQQYGAIITTATYNDNTWKEVVFVMNGSTVSNWKIHINGSLVNTSLAFESQLTLSGSGISNNVPLTLGTREFGGFYNGNISQVSIYNRALTAKEIKQNYNATKKRYGL
jgi:hypothetical protein